MRLVVVVLALLVWFGGLGGITCGEALAIDMPGPCQDVEISPLQDSIVINGTVPDNYDAAEVKGVHIYRGTDPENLTLQYTLKVYTETALFFIYQDTSISNGITYYYSVAAFNALGDGNRSAVLNATCLGAPPAPQGLSASVSCTHVHLCWYPPLSDGGRPVTHYTVYRGLRGGEPVRIANVTSHSYDDTNVTFDDSYYSYEVCAVNEYGAGKRSMTVFASLPMPVVSGRLTGTDGNPLAGALVEVDNNGTVACTDSNGSFTIAVTPGPHTLTIWVDGNAIHQIDLVTPIGTQDLGVIPVNDKMGTGFGLDTLFLVGVVAVVTTGMVIWATGKPKLR